MEQRVQTVPQMGQGGCFSITCSRHVQGIGPGCRPGGRHDRRHHRKGSPLGPGRRRGTLCRAIGRSRAGITTKTPALTELGNLVDFCLMPGQAHDLRETAGLPHDVSAGHLLADRALDAGWLRNDLPDRDMTPVIPPKSNRRFPAGFDNETCKWRHLIENCFGKRKENRGTAMRSCKTDQSFKAFIPIAAAIIHTR